LNLANELLALHNLPCLSSSELWDRSQISAYIHHRLRHVEVSGDVSVLEEAGRLLTIQRMAAPPAGTTSQRESGTVVTGMEQGQIPGYQYYGSHDLPLRPRPSGMQDPAHNLFTHANPSKASANNFSHSDDFAVSEIRGSAAHMTATANLHNNNHAASDSVAMSFPSRLTDNYPDSLMRVENPRLGNKHWPFVDAESAEIARMNEEMLGGGSL
jgi:hypothetical protein